MSRNEARRKKFGHLEVLHVEKSAEGPTVIVFHGFGADNQDLASLASAVQVLPGTNWVFPNGHLTVPIGPHQEGRAWFPISIADLNKSAATGDSLDQSLAPALDWSGLVPPGLKRAREHALEMIEKLGVPPERLLLAGFSQGAMLATEVALRLEKPPAGLAILSGTLINTTDWEARAKKHAGFSFFQSHGQRDTVLSFAMAQRLEKVLVGAGWRGQLLGFDGGHEIPFNVLIQLGAYIRARLGPKT